MLRSRHGTLGLYDTSDCICIQCLSRDQYGVNMLTNGLKLIRRSEAGIAPWVPMLLAQRQQGGRRRQAPQLDIQRQI